MQYILAESIVWVWAGRVSTIIGLLSLFVTIYYSFNTWRKTSSLFADNRKLMERQKVIERRLKERITLILVEVDKDFCKTGENVVLPYKPRRDQLSRAELIGILGTYNGEKRFDSKMLAPILIDGSLSRVLAGEDQSSDWDETLRIPCPSDVFKGFQSSLKHIQSKVCTQIIDDSSAPQLELTR